MNNSAIIGRLVADPDLRTTTSGISVCSFKVAVRRIGNDKVDYIPVVAWRGQADNCAKFLKKGSLVGVSGRIQIRDYTPGDGIKRYITEIHANDVQFLSPKNSTGDTSEPPKDATPSGGDSPVDGYADADGYGADNYDDFEPLDDEQMPF